jgi:integrase
LSCLVKNLSPVASSCSARSTTVGGAREIGAKLRLRTAQTGVLRRPAVWAGVRTDNPVPAERRSGGARARRGLLGHLGPGRPRGGGRLVRAPRRLPESLDPAEVAAFVADLRTARDRAIALLMLLGGLRAGEVRALLLADVDQGCAGCG